MTNLPRGTVTLLFTDIEGSTRLLQEVGVDRYVRALEHHRRLLREAFNGRGGVEVETQGDSFHFAFSDARAAVLAAADLQRALAEHEWEIEPIRVRVGIHTGTPLVTDSLYAGLDVHRAARVMNAAHGGQVLLSETTQAIVATKPLDGLSLCDLGDHRLKDLSAPQRLYQLGDREFPPLRSLYRTNLPVPGTPFLGREREIQEVSALLADEGVRLLTLTGAGGSGKTRLAAQAASEVSAEFPDGVFWVGLAALRDPELVTASIAQALETSEELSVHIGSKRLLLLLDNFEHLTAAATELAELVTACPKLTLLLTSREPLHLSAEHEYPVLPLREEDASLLFRERVQAAGIAVTEDASVAEICRRLDCLPLAIELAAARANVLTPDALLERLEPRLPLLTGGPRDAPERQRTLRSTIAWSHELLSADEQHLFARLAVFSGGWTLDAAEQICDADIDTLQSLLDKSLGVLREGRYRMLETIREYALEQLDERGERDAIERRHVDYYAAFATGLEGAFFGVDGTSAHHQLESEHDNLRAVLRRALDAGDGELALRLANALAPYWRSSHNSEGLRWLEEALAMTGAATMPLRARAHLRAGVLANRSGDDTRALWHWERTLEVSREFGDNTAAAGASVNIGNHSVQLRDYEDAAARFEQATEFFAEVGDDYRCSMALNNHAILLLLQGEHDHAAELVARALSLLPEGEEEETASILHTDGVVRLTVGDSNGARTAFAQLVDIAVRLGDTTLIAAGIEGFASLAAAAKDWDRAASLFGFVSAYCTEHEVSDAVTRELAEPYLRSVQEAMGSEELDQAWRRGEAMSAADAASIATAVPSRPLG